MTRELLARLPGVTVVGGCCGTDRRHVSALWETVATRGADATPALGAPPPNGRH